jgi:hypothetical protein
MGGSLCRKSKRPPRVTVPPEILPEKAPADVKMRNAAVTSWTEYGKPGRRDGWWAEVEGRPATPTAGQRQPAAGRAQSKETTMGLRLAALRRTTKLTALILAAAVTTRAFAFAGGTGEPNDPYQIGTAEQLMSIGSDPNLLDKHFVLVADIDLDPNLPGRRIFTQAVIAPDTDDRFGYQGAAFTGSFDGNGCRISNLTVDSTLGDHVGLFGTIGPWGFGENLRLERFAVTGAHYVVGGLAGTNYGTIVGCSASGSVRAGVWTYIESLGGLTGLNLGRIIQSCAQANIHGNTQSKCLGELVGTNLFGRIVSCHATGMVTGEDCLGGLAGNNVEGTISDCYAAGSVSSERFSLHSGGLVGHNQAGTVVNCYAATLLRNGAERWDWGGLIGDNPPRDVAGVAMIKGATAGCFWDAELSGASVSDGGTGLTTAQMQSPDTFLAAGWDFDTVWMICEGKTYPHLQWEDVDCADAAQSGN